MVGTAFFFKKIISLVTSVLADSEKVVLGKRIAPKKSALSEIYLLTLPSFLSRVPLEVTKLHQAHTDLTPLQRNNHES